MGADLLWITLSVTRRQSSVGCWIFSAAYVGGFLLMIYLLSRGLLRLSGVAWPFWVVTLASIPQLILLWSPTTSKGLASRESPSDGEETGIRPRLLPLTEIGSIAIGRPARGTLAFLERARA